MTFKAGWALMYRLHGANVTEEGKEAMLQILAPVFPGLDILIRIGHGWNDEVPTPLKAIEGGRSYGVKGTAGTPLTVQALPPPNEGSKQCWFFVMVSKDFSAKPTVPELEAEMRPFALFIPAICVGFFPETIFFLEAENYVLWGDDGKPLFSVEMEAVSLEPTAITKHIHAEFDKYLVGLVRFTDEVLNILAVAGHWYTEGIVKRERSLDRFTGMFLCLEALTRLVDDTPDPNDLAEFEELETLARLHITKAGEYLKRRKSTILRPGLNRLFDRMAQGVSPLTAVQDGKDFRKLNGIRNTVIHPKVLHIEPVKGLPNPGKRITELAKHYLVEVTHKFSTEKIERLQS